MREILFYSKGDAGKTFAGRIALGCEALAMAACIVLAALLPFADLTASREIALFAGLGAWVIRMIALREVAFVRTPLDLPLFLFLIVEIISLFTTSNFPLAFSHFTGELLYWIILYYVAVNNIRTEKRALALIVALLAGALVMDAYGIFEYLYQGGSLYEPVFRSRSFHASAPQFGMYIVQVLPFVLISPFFAKRKKWRVLLSLFAAVHFFALYLTFSRMDLVSAVFQVAIFLHIWGFSIKKTVLLAVVAVLIASPFLPRPILFIHSNRPNLIKIGPIGIPGIYGSRFRIWKTSIDYVAEHPFAGIGGGRHLFKWRFPELSAINPAFWHSHNILLTMAVGLGVQGLAVFLFLYYRVVRYLWPGSDASGGNRLASVAGYMMSATMIMAVGFFLSNMPTDIFEDDAALLFWLLVGAAFSVRHFVVGPGVEQGRGGMMSDN